MTIRNITSNLEKAVQLFEQALRQDLKPVLEPKDDYEFKVSINRTWRWSANKEELKIEYSLYSNGQTVEGGSVTEVISEWKRRKGWKEVHEAKATVLLSAPEVPAQETEDSDA